MKKIKESEIEAIKEEEENYNSSFEEEAPKSIDHQADHLKEADRVILAEKTSSNKRKNFKETISGDLEEPGQPKHEASANIFEHNFENQQIDVLTQNFLKVKSSKVRLSNDEICKNENRDSQNVNDSNSYGFKSKSSLQFTKSCKPGRNAETLARTDSGKDKSDTNTAWTFNIPHFRKNTAVEIKCKRLFFFDNDSITKNESRSQGRSPKNSPVWSKNQNPEKTPTSKQNTGKKSLSNNIPYSIFRKYQEPLHVPIVGERGNMRGRPTSRTMAENTLNPQPVLHVPNKNTVFKSRKNRKRYDFRFQSERQQSESLQPNFARTSNNLSQIMISVKNDRNMNKSSPHSPLNSLRSSTDAHFETLKVHPVDSANITESKP
jgi:hypothetical protein